MDVSTVLRACLRCWYVMVLVLAGTGYLAVGYYQDAEAQYTVSTQVLVVPSMSLQAIRLPSSGTNGGSSNPFNATSGASTLANSLATALNTTRVQVSLLPGGTALAAGWDTEANSTVTLTTLAVDTQGAEAAMTAVLGQVDVILTDIQTRAGAPADQLYVTSLITDPDFPDETFPDRLRLVIGTVLAGLVVAVVLAVLLDGLLARRRNAQHLAAPGEAGAGRDRRRGGPGSGSSGEETMPPSVTVREGGGGQVERLLDDPPAGVPTSER